MSTAAMIRHIFYSSVAAALLAGCGGVQPPEGAQGAALRNPLAGAPRGTPVPPAPAGIRPLGWLSPATSSEPVIYVADQSTSAIDVYPENGGAPIGEITDGVAGPYGLFVDKHGTLYVGNQSGNTVTAYPAGSLSPSMTWSQRLDQPHYPIVDAKGNLFVSNEGSGTVVEYRHGETSAYTVLRTPGKETDGMDFDTEGNLYVAFRHGDGRGRGGIEEFAPNSSQGTVLPMKLNEPQGLIVDSSGAILVVETGTAHRVAVFRNSGKEWAFLKVQGPSGATFTQLALTANQSELFASALGGMVFDVSYPLSASSQWSELLGLQNSVIQGLAISNGQTF